MFFYKKYLYIFVKLKRQKNNTTRTKTKNYYIIRKALHENI